MAIDYNLLRPLRALLEERSVTRAAERLHMSQPAMSTALGRLRAHYDDVLLVRRGNQHVLTPLAERLLTAVPHAIAETEQVFRIQSRFDPAISTRTFTIAAVDYMTARIAPALTQIVLREAPNVRFEFPAADGRLVEGMPDVLRTIDGAILPHGYVSNHPHIDFAPEEWVCLVDAASGVPERPSADELLTRPWVQTLPAREGASPARQQLRFRGIEPTVVAATPHFFVVPSLLLGTDRVAMVPEAFARMAVDREPRLRLVVPPLDLDPVKDAFWWHLDREQDAEHVWLRSVIERVGRTVIRNPNDGDTPDRLP
ncbi:DNA-binding transcriptional LysR family regulator [Pseudoclavibacter chungangensis]|uniref:LysR family transcriptional regulator n=1 Tax=Pseudoclavibacter chungangensis TaxID=587635 RepID=UPI0015C88A7A|nr:LysR family transcriptional regulator [Pseudoclavibacter chungangensis]NYJ67163.1 DNA-binding transcriptional LysR family regulator [Pseudoclavibacter chungangensis]